VTTSAPLLGEPLPVALMNTIWADRDGVHDALETAGHLTQWLVSVEDRLDVPLDLATGSIPATQLTRARNLRDALRRLAADATGDDRPLAASAVDDTDRALTLLNSAAAHAPRWNALQQPTRGGAPTRLTKTAKSAPDAAISQIADDAIALFSDGSGAVLRACRAPGCVLYFVRQHPRRDWCSAACGNRARVARHYQRHNTARD
jgi:predicted RNA-binding Zn ribbon-like protein